MKYEKEEKASNRYVLQMRNISKSFPGVKALDNVDFDLKKGEVHVLLGENGAGKSTLMKIISGVYKQDFGDIIFEGKKISINNPTHSKELGIRMIYQELGYFPHLSVAENIFIDNLPKKKFLLDRLNMWKSTENMLNEFGLKINPKTLVDKLNIPERQLLEIIRAVMFNSKLVIMDEPTSSLSEPERIRLFNYVNKLKNRNVGIIYISHKLEDIEEVGDRCTVLRNGKKAGSIKINDETKGEVVQKIIKMMIGKTINQKFGYKINKEIGNEILRVNKLTRTNKFKNISFSLSEGEILGITGLVGAGKTELVQSIFGLDKYDYGSICIRSHPVKINSVQDAIKMGVSVIPEDRLEYGNCQRLSVSQNIILPSLSRFSSMGIVNLVKANNEVEEYVRKLDIKTTSLNELVKYLSGGNQQKVVIAKWLMKGSEIFIFDSPTRGIDIGAKTEVYNLIRDLAKKGKGVIFISDEIPEVISISDRILTMYKGLITGILLKAEASENKVMSLIYSDKIKGEN